MGYASDAQRKAVHASKADGGKGNPNKMLSPAEMHCTGKNPVKHTGKLTSKKHRKKHENPNFSHGNIIERGSNFVEKVKDSKVGQIVEGGVKVAKGIKSVDLKKASEGIKQVSDAVGKMVVDPMTGMNMQSQMSNMPPQPSNTMGNARPVFNSRAQDVANNIYGGMQARQNAAGATPVYPNEMPVQTPLFKEEPKGKMKEPPPKKKERRTRKDGSVVDTDGSVYPPGFFDKKPKAN